MTDKIKKALGDGAKKLLSGIVNKIKAEVPVLEKKELLALADALEKEAGKLRDLANGIGA